MNQSKQPPQAPTLPTRQRSTRTDLLLVGGACVFSIAVAACSVKVHAGFDSNAPETPTPSKTAASATTAAPETSAAPSQPPAEASSAPTGASEATSADEPTPAAPELPPVERKGGKLILPGNLVFDSGATTLAAGAQNEAILEQLKSFLVDNPAVTQIRVEGHTDNTGDPSANLELSGQRALTVKNYLVSQGIADTRVLAVGFGDTKPIADNATEAGKAQNRRTEFRIATVKGLRYLGKDPLGGGTEFK